MKGYIGAHRNIVFTGLVVIALALYVIPFSGIIVPVSGQFDCIPCGDLIFDIVGNDAVNIARNLASFQDSSFNTLTQSNDQSIGDTLIQARIERIRSAVAENTGINDATFVNSDNNVIDQSNNQGIRDVSEGSDQNRVVLSGLPAHIRIRTVEGSEAATAVPVPIFSIEAQSGATNTGVNNAELVNSNNNDVGQINNQVVRDTLISTSTRGTEASNTGVNNAEFENSDSNDVDQSNEGIHDVRAFSVDRSGRNQGVNNAEFEDSDNNDVDQSNDQNIEEVGGGSDVSNEGVNNVEFENSDNNDVDQSNDQEIEDVEEDSSASNDAGNSVSLDDGDGDDSDCQVC